jgi:hypothetical protein
MNIPVKTKHFIFVLCSLLISVVLTACSDDKSNQIEQISFDHAHGSNVSDLKKHTFEHKFADQCIERETRNSINKEDDKKRFAKPCLCIATRIMKNLTAVEAEKFLVEKKSTQSLKMSFDEAAYFCLQKNKSRATVKAPVLFGKK